MKAHNILASLAFFAFHNLADAQAAVDQLTFKDLALGTHIAIFKEKILSHHCGKKTGEMTICLPEIGTYANKRVESATAFFIEEKFSRIQLTLSPKDNNEILIETTMDVMRPFIERYGGPDSIEKRKDDLGFDCEEYAWKRPEGALVLASHKAPKKFARSLPKLLKSDFVSVEVSVQGFFKKASEAAQVKTDADI